jgi:mono/diheme cytochrome c family protein
MINMKKLSIIVVLVLAVAVWSCSDVKRDQNRVYMPDMAYSRAVETYSDIDTLEHQGIHYTRMPVPGTVKRGELAPFALPADKAGDSTNYVLSKQLVNPLPALTEAQTKEAERLYLVNCGICHGTALDGNGPLYNGGKGPFAAQPANLATNPLYVNMPIGQMFYSVTYGKGQMGSYASQLSSTQRWAIVQYVKNQQGGNKAPAAGAAATDTAAPAGADAATDTAAKK